MKLRAFIVALSLALPALALAQSTAFPPAGTVAIGPPSGVKGWRGVAPGTSNNCLISNGTAWISGTCPSSGGGPPSGAAGGDLGGTYPNPTVVDLQAGVASTNLGIFSIADYTAGGTGNDTVGVQAAMTACSGAGGCLLVCARGVTYTIDAVTIPSNTKLDGSGCIFQQRTASNAMFTMTSVSNIQIYNGTFYSTSPTVQTEPLIQINGSTNVGIRTSYFRGSATVDSGYAGPNGGATAVLIYGSSNYINIAENDFFRFTYLPIYAVQSSNIKTDRNSFRSVAYGPRYRQVTVGSMDDNIFDTSVLYSVTPTDNQFVVVFGLDSTEPDPDFPSVTGLSSKISISRNLIKTIGYGQGVLVHAGQHVNVSNNVCEVVAQCIGITPFNTTDNIDYLIVNGNIMTGATGVDQSGVSSPSDVGIIIQSGGANPTITNVTVNNNVIAAQNRVADDSASGCIMFGVIEKFTANNNVLNGCGASAIVIASPINGAVMNGNNVANTITVGGENNGIFFRSASTGARANLIGNYFQDMTNGIKYASGISVGNIQSLGTLCVTVTNCTSGP